MDQEALDKIKDLVKNIVAFKISSQDKTFWQDQQEMDEFLESISTKEGSEYTSLGIQKIIDSLNTLLGDKPNLPNVLKTIAAGKTIVKEIYDIEQGLADTDYRLWTMDSNEFRSQHELTGLTTEQITGKPSEWRSDEELFKKQQDSGDNSESLATNASDLKTLFMMLTTLEEQLKNELQKEKSALNQRKKVHSKPQTKKQKSDEIERLAHLILESEFRDFLDLELDPKAKQPTYRYFLSKEHPQAVKDAKKEKDKKEKEAREVITPVNPEEDPKVITTVNPKDLHFLKASKAILTALKALEKNGDARVKSGVLQDAYRLAVREQEFYTKSAELEGDIVSEKNTKFIDAAEAAGRFIGNAIDVSNLRQDSDLDKVDGYRDIEGLLSDLMERLKIQVPRVGRNI